jgi:SAM-dependent methyltransferase
MSKEEKKILDVCCGGRMFWFNKKHPDALYLDNRVVEPCKLSNGATFEVAPDLVMDFRNLDLPSNSFSLVVFDPPQVLRAGKTSFLAKKYGYLNKNAWQNDLRRGFAECFRVLKPNGVLVFKWNEMHIPLKEILALTDQEPLFGHRSGKASKTHWLTFMKL